MLHEVVCLVQIHAKDLVHQAFRYLVLELFQTFLIPLDLCQLGVQVVHIGRIRHFLLHVVPKRNDPIVSLLVLFCDLVQLLV